MERLTERKTTKGITKTVIKPCIKTNEAMLLVVNKLCAFEDILEKYNIDSLGELNETLNDNYYAKEVVIMLRNRSQELQNERDIWKKACKKISEWLKQNLIVNGGKSTESDVEYGKGYNACRNEIKELLDQIQKELLK